MFSTILVEILKCPVVFVALKLSWCPQVKHYGSTKFWNGNGLFLFVILFGVAGQFYFSIEILKNNLWIENKFILGTEKGQKSGRKSRRKTTDTKRKKCGQPSNNGLVCHTFCIRTIKDFSGRTTFKAKWIFQREYFSMNECLNLLKWLIALQTKRESPGKKMFTSGLQFGEVGSDLFVAKG